MHSRKRTIIARIKYKEKQMSIFSSLNISASGLSVQRRRMESISKNLANVETTRTEEGGPYRKERVLIGEIKQQSTFSKILNRLQTRLKLTNSFYLRPSIKHTQTRMTAGGAEIENILQDETPPRTKFDPGHPDADENGYVHLPNINVITEMVDLISATRAYEANLSVIDATKNIVKKSLEI